MKVAFKISFYILLIVLISVFFLKDVNFKKMFYKEINTIENPNELLVLVNKNNKLEQNYVPNNLETIDVKYSNENKQLQHIAKESFENLSADALKIGLKIVAVSAYRDYNYQDKLFNQYMLEYGNDYALDCSAKAGHSEHQTGLAVDVMGSNNDYDNFEDTPEFDWIKDNAYKYGFILRYPKDKTKITGFKYEPWHYRYVGYDAAKTIYEKNITLEEYLENK